MIASVGTRYWRPAVALIALGYLVAMIAAGARPVQRQLVTFEAKGVLTSDPEQVSAIELRRGGTAVALSRAADATWWREAGGTLAPAAQKHVQTAVNMMHRSGPVRVLTREDLSGVDVAAFGLSVPVIVASLKSRGGAALTVRFGAHNPEGFLQYMQIDGDDRLYLMSRFVGAEWIAAFETAGSR